MGLQRSQFIFFAVALEVVVFVSFTHAHLDRPGPPYPDDSNGGVTPSQRPSGGRGFKSGYDRPNILHTLYRAFGPGSAVHAPSRNRNPEQNSFENSHSQVQHLQSQPQPQPQEQYQYDHPHSQSEHAQTAHVYMPRTKTDFVQRPMPNVIVRYQPTAQGSVFNNQLQSIDQYSPSSEPGIQKAVQLQQFSQSQSGIQQYSQPQVSIQQYSQPQVSIQQYSQPQTAVQQYSQPQTAVQQYSQPQAAIQVYPQPQQQQYQAQQQAHRYQTNLSQESESTSPSSFSLNFQFPPNKGGHKHKSRLHYVTPHVKTHKKKSHRSQAYPVFTTIGKGLDGLNAVRRGVKKGTGKVVATGVKLGGKLAYVGAGVVAKVIKAASSI